MKPLALLCTLAALSPAPQGISIRTGMPLPGGGELTVVEVRPQLKEVRPVLSSEMRTTRAIAQGVGAEVAINGGFFNHLDGANASYIVIDGKTVSDPHNNALLVGNQELHPYLPKIFNRTELRMLEGKHGPRLSVSAHSDPVPPGFKLRHSLQAGPRLLPRIQLEEEGFVAYGMPDRHGKRQLKRDGIAAFTPLPRSAVGLKPDGTMLLIAVVGRGTGLTLPQLKDQCAKLGCQEAMALDGGSSTSLSSFVSGSEKLVAPPWGEAKVRSILIVRNF